MKSSNKKPKSYVGLLLLAYIAFIALGMPDGLLGVGWPSIRATFGIPLDSMGFLLFASTSGYLVSAFLNGKLIARMGVGGVLAASCALTGAALICESLVPSWWMMVLLGVCCGFGAGAIDAGLNTYMAANYNESLMQWLHASYGVGITSGPLIMTAALTNFSSWQIGYRIVGGVQIFLALCFLISLPIWKQKPVEGGQQPDKRLTDYNTSYSETLRQPQVWLSLVLFMLYCGAEIAFGAWAYSVLTEARGVDPQTAGFWTGSYWAMFTIGRALAGLYTRRIGNSTLVKISVGGAMLGAGLLWWNPSPTVSVIGVALIGFSIAPIFPALTSGTSRRVSPRFAANTIGMQMAGASLGGVLVPSLIGVLARNISLDVVPVCMFVLYAVLMMAYLVSEKVSIPEQVGPKMAELEETPVDLV